MSIITLILLGIHDSHIIYTSHINTCTCCMCNKIHEERLEGVLGNSESIPIQHTVPKRLIKIWKLQYHQSIKLQFILIVAAKYCIDIAMHQHGCCILQRCINISNGEHREKSVAEISANGLLLAQDPFGNYVVQFILELKIPSATYIQADLSVWGRLFTSLNAKF